MCFFKQNCAQNAVLDLDSCFFKHAYARVPPLYPLAPAPCLYGKFFVWFSATTVLGGQRLVFSNCQL